MATSPKPPSRRHARPPRLAQQVRERFVQEIDSALLAVGVKVQTYLITLVNTGRFASVTESRQALDTEAAYQREQTNWIDLCRQRLQDAQKQVRTPDSAAGGLGSLGLVDDEVVERKIIASRLAAAITDGAGSELNDLSIRMQWLERVKEWKRGEVLAPETLAQLVVQAWIDCDLTRAMWALVQTPVTEAIRASTSEAYRHANELLISEGVMEEIDMKSRVRRAENADGWDDEEEDEDESPPTEMMPYRPEGPTGAPRYASRGADGRLVPPGYGGAPTSRGAPAWQDRGTRQGGLPGQSAPPGYGGQPGRYADAYGDTQGAWQDDGSHGGGGYAPTPMYGARGGAPGGAPAGGRYPGGRYPGGRVDPYERETGYPGAPTQRMGYPPSMLDTQTPTVHPTALARAAQETRMMTGVTPMARVRQKAQGVLGQLRRFISDRVGDLTVPAGVSAGPSPALARALDEQITPFAVTEWTGTPGAGGMGAVGPADVQRVAVQLRRRATDLKEKAEKPSEKAIIEIVALMFQAILAEERIPPAIRVWFARLQIPVLRLALAEPDFFASTEHPARQLIDRMGGCVLGFDGSQILGSKLEREIKRIVQVIEQYPETGRRVYQLVLDEFKKFLGRSLADNGAVQQAATLAQQVEQKEALGIQYTIELRRMLNSVPVADEVREFLFRVWSEVLALSAVRYGAQHAETLRLKQAAADLLWAVSPKPDRDDRRRVVQHLSGLLQTLRSGMSMLAVAESEQDAQIKRINDAVMAAFVSRDEGLPQEKLEELARGLAGLEDVVTDDPEGDMLLDPGTIELMFGVDQSALEVIAAGGSLPNEGMVDWARNLELGGWFGLDAHGSVKHVQYVWRSDRGQLHLFSSGVGKSYLVQTRRMAAYLQAGLLVPIEDEALTVRATREALAKLNAAPTQLLQ